MPFGTVDSHVHLSRFRDEGQSFSQVRDDLLSSMKHLGIARAIVIPDSEAGSAVSDLDTTIELTRGIPELPMVGTAEIPTMNQLLLDKLESLATTKQIVGMKLYPGYEPFYPIDARCREIYEMCIRHDLPVVIHSSEYGGDSKYNHPTEIANVADRHPELKIVVAHFSVPRLDACRELVLRYSNVYAEISGMADPEVVRDCGGRAVVEEVAADVANRQPYKLLFSTDWPLCGFEEHLDLVRTLPVSDSIKSMILSENAVRVFGLDP